MPVTLAGDAHSNQRECQRCDAEPLEQSLSVKRIMEQEHSSENDGNASAEADKRLQKHSEGCSFLVRRIF